MPTLAKPVACLPTRVSSALHETSDLLAAVAGQVRPFTQTRAIPDYILNESPDVVVIALHGGSNSDLKLAGRLRDLSPASVMIFHKLDCAAARDFLSRSRFGEQIDLMRPSLERLAFSPLKRM